MERSLLQLRLNCGQKAMSIALIIKKLSVKAPPAELKIKLLKAITQEYNLEWDSSSTEAELSKQHEDLVDGLNPTNSQALMERSSFTSTEEGVSASTAKNQNVQLPQSLIHWNIPKISAETCKISPADAVSQTEALSLSEKSRSTQVHQSLLL